MKLTLWHTYYKHKLITTMKNTIVYMKIYSIYEKYTIVVYSFYSIDDKREPKKT